MRLLAATNPRFRAAVSAVGLDPDDALTLAEAAARTGLSRKIVERNAQIVRLRTARVGTRRVTTSAWLRAWVEVWYPEHAGRV